MNIKQIFYSGSTVA